MIVGGARKTSRTFGFSAETRTSDELAAGQMEQLIHKGNESAQGDAAPFRLQTVEGDSLK